jgi:hypothetical protein
MQSPVLHRWDSCWDSQLLSVLGLMFASHAATQLAGTLALAGGFQSWDVIRVISLFGMPIRGFPVGLSLSLRAVRMHSVPGRVDMLVPSLFWSRSFDRGSSESIAVQNAM